MKHSHLEHQLLTSIVAEGWRTVGVRNHHGINVFLNAIHSTKSCGIGEFLNLLPLIDWCKKIGMDIIQLLPLNDSYLDPSPYNAISSCALNPVFLTLDALPYLEQHPQLKDAISHISATFNHLPRTDYTAVFHAKMQWLRGYYQEIAAQLEEEQSFFNFKSAFPWVETYALFKVLLCRFNSAWESWPEDCRSLSAEKRTQLLEEHREEIAFHTALQYFSFQQLQQVRLYAENQGVFIKGDVPILISRNSADVWHAPHFFDLNRTAGAPPDQYSVEGQNWGFPLFDWEAMRKEDYRFWCQRLHTAGHLYHLYRIDHAVGFFRIWGIPVDHPSRDGYFIPEEPTKYMEQGAHLLGVLAAASSMLPIAEDLGSVPREVRTCLTEMGIPGTRVMRWEVDWTRDRDPYLTLNEYQPLSMTCVSTHDSDTLGGWWHKYPEQASPLAHQKHWHYMHNLSIEHRQALLADSHRTTSLFHINILQEYLALVPEFVSPNPDEERINIPGTILPTNWTYRYRPSVETLTSHQHLLHTMQSLVPT